MHHVKRQQSWRYKVREAAATLAQGQARHRSSMRAFPGARHCLPSAMPGVRFPSLGATSLLSFSVVPLLSVLQSHMLLLKGLSAVYFLFEWARLSRGEPLMFSPFHDRKVL
ncbi:hypothetical protein HAX54_036024 [Datura stramonium]|uniref:Uncharacterized protein n=1 Tax=Datura stramonium TaxID=4076 RepID=A0ABS8VHU8_DATST|nr:hypothetical protein [Datura stramonium]